MDARTELHMMMVRNRITDLQDDARSTRTPRAWSEIPIARRVIPDRFDSARLPATPRTILSRA